jgi:hypothetical protein
MQASQYLHQEDISSIEHIQIKRPNSQKKGGNVNYVLPRHAITLFKITGQIPANLNQSWQEIRQ